MFSFFFDFLKTLNTNREFKIQTQRSENDCGITILSVASGVKYSKLIKEFPEMINGASCPQMQKAIKFIKMKNDFNFYRFNRKEFFNFKNNKGIYLIKNNGEYGHWVLLDKFNNVYDTYTAEVVQIEKYYRKHHRVIACFFL